MNGQDLHQTDECCAKEAGKPHSEVSPWDPKGIGQASNDYSNEPDHYACNQRVDEFRGLCEIKN
jgi:hypothetical protein